jgi:hypothetical protein
MADSNIKKSIIDPLPEFSGETGKYKLRYRIISDDRNRVSHWSEIHEITVPSVTQLTTTSYQSVVEEINQPGGKKIHVVNLWWTPNNSYLFNYYDVYLALNKAVGEPTVSDYEYYGRVFSPSFSVYLDDDTTDNFSVIIHSPTYDRIINSNHILIKTAKHVL